MLRKFSVLPTKLGKTLARSSAFDAPTENLKTITPLLYQSGYITIKGYDKMSQLFTLDLPNKEIKVGLFESLLPNYLEGMYAEEGDVAIAQCLKGDKVQGVGNLLKAKDLGDAQADVLIEKYGK